MSNAPMSNMPRSPKQHSRTNSSLGSSMLTRKPGILLPPMGTRFDASLTSPRIDRPPLQGQGPPPIRSSSLGAPAFGNPPRENQEGHVSSPELPNSELEVPAHPVDSILSSPGEALERVASQGNESSDFSGFDFGLEPLLDLTDASRPDPDATSPQWTEAELDSPSRPTSRSLRTPELVPSLRPNLHTPQQQTPVQQSRIGQAARRLPDLHHRHGVPWRYLDATFTLTAIGPDHPTAITVVLHTLDGLVLQVNSALRRASKSSSPRWAVLDDHEYTIAEVSTEEIYRMIREESNLGLYSEGGDWARPNRLDRMTVRDCSGMENNRGEEEQKPDSDEDVDRVPNGAKGQPGLFHRWTRA